MVHYICKYLFYPLRKPQTLILKPKPKHHLLLLTKMSCSSYPENLTACIRLVVKIKVRKNDAIIYKVQPNLKMKNHIILISWATWESIGGVRKMRGSCEVLICIKQLKLIGSEKSIYLTPPLKLRREAACSSSTDTLGVQQWLFWPCSFWPWVWPRDLVLALIPLKVILITNTS